MSNNLDAFPGFMAAVQARLRLGAQAYGNKSFSLPPLALLKEIQDELLDVCGWAYILHSRLERVRALAVLDREGGDTLPPYD